MKSEIACRIFKKAHLTGEFKLRSGLVSNEYFDKYLFESEPKLLLDIVEYNSRRCRNNSWFGNGRDSGSNGFVNS